jgi:hypothetical protein
MAKDALNGPQVEAVEQFRKAIAESEEQQQKNPELSRLGESVCRCSCAGEGVM